MHTVTHRTEKKHFITCVIICNGLSNVLATRKMIREMGEGGRKKRIQSAVPIIKLIKSYIDCAFRLELIYLDLRYF